MLPGHFVHKAQSKASDTSDTKVTQKYESKHLHLSYTRSALPLERWLLPRVLGEKYVQLGCTHWQQLKSWTKELAHSRKNAPVALQTRGGLFAS